MVQRLFDLPLRHQDRKSEIRSKFQSLFRDFFIGTNQINNEESENHDPETSESTFKAPGLPALTLVRVFWSWNHKVIVSGPRFLDST